MEYNKPFFEKVFSNKRMERYFRLYEDEKRAIDHYRSNIELAESFYPCLSVFEVTLRNALSRELETMAGREDWYSIFPTTPGLVNLNRYITQAQKQIINRKENVTPAKVIAELTLGFWVSLLNSEYERLLWKHLRQRKNVSAPLNSFRAFRNRVFHHESICWNLHCVSEIHDSLFLMLEWMNKDLPLWLKPIDRFEDTKERICLRMNWNNE